VGLILLVPCGTCGGFSLNYIFSTIHVPFFAPLTIQDIQSNNHSFNFKDKPSSPVKCESELKMPCESSSTMDMRHLSSKLLEICEEEFQKKLGSVLRNLVDKLEAEVR
jgi:C4-type Zn-finger protein